MPHVLAQDLRDAVLQAAVSGGLTEKEAGDTNITEYYKSLIDNKASNVASKKWKKEFPVERIDNSEFEYDLGENWIWCYLGDICAIRGGKRVPVGRKLSDKATSQKYIRVADMKDHSVLLDGIKYLPDDLVDRLSLYTISKDDLYITVAGTIGDVGIIHDELDGANLTENADKIVFEKINKRWLLICLLSNGVQKQIKAATTQVGQPKLAIKRIQSLYIPLCPIEEQARIVAKVDELMAKIDEYEKIEKELTELQEAFPGNMKDAILQAAFSGGLTERCNEDSSVDEYLNDCRDKRLEYEKKYKEKKHKSLWEAGDYETPFDIPDDWRWAYVGDIFRHNAGKALNAKDTAGTKRKYLTTSNVYTDHFELDNLREMYYTDDEVEKCSVQKGDLLVLEGGDCGRTALWDLDESYCIQNHLHRLRLFGEGNIKYFFYLLSFYKDAGYTKGKGIAIQGLSANALHHIVIPIPPVEEQARIVDKLDQLLPLCEQLEKMAA